VSLFKVQIELNNQTVTAVVDSGAACSLISSELASDLNLVIDNNQTKLKVVGQDDFNCTGSAQCQITIHGIKMVAISLSVFPANDVLNIPLILGVDFLKANHVELCIKKRLLIKHFKDGGCAEIYADLSGKSKLMLCNVNCQAAGDISINAGEVACVPILYEAVSDNVDNQLLLYSDDKIDPKLTDNIHGLAGLSSLSQKSVLLMATESSVTIKKGQSVGLVNTVLELPDNDGPDDQVVVGTTDLESQVGLPELTADQKTSVYAMLKEHASVFSLGDHDVGLASVTEHDIKLTDYTPIYQRPRRFPQPVTDEIEKQCQELKSRYH
jgi:hypothetical protein